MNKTKLRLLMLVAIWAGSSWLSPAQAQSAQYTCTPAGSTSGANCISPEIGPWRYHIYQLGYNWDNAYSNTTWFETAGQMFAWIQARVEVKSSNSWCNVEHTATDWNYTGLPPLYDGGVLVRSYIRPHYSYDYYVPIRPAVSSYIRTMLIRTSRRSVTRIRQHALTTTN